jgi:hypothetical protein
MPRAASRRTARRTIRGRRIDHFRRLEDGHWLSTTRTDDASVKLTVLGGTLSLADVYAGVVFGEGRSGAT